MLFILYILSLKQENINSIIRQYLNLKYTEDKRIMRERERERIQTKKNYHFFIIYISKEVLLLILHNVIKKNFFFTNELKFINVYKK